MISDALQKWPVVVVIFLSTVFSQIMMQMPYPMGGYGMMMMPPPPMMMPPPPMPMPFPVGIMIPYPESTTTTTTTTTTVATPGPGGGGDGDTVQAIAIPFPVPHFVQIAIPSFLPPHCQNGSNKNCPPCPPCSCNPCTPSFFSYCSPCHLQCRCKNGQQNPSPQEPIAPIPITGPAFPMPVPVMPAQPPIVIIPFPPQFKNPQPPEKSAECSFSHSSVEESLDCSDNNSRRKKHRKKNKVKKKYDIYRRSIGLVKKNYNNDELVHPVLSYRTRNGEIKMKMRLTNDEANALLEEDKPVQDVRIMTGEDSNNRPRVLVMSNSSKRNGRRHRQLLLHGGQSQQMLKEGRNEMVFRPPDNMKINNLSLSFRIAK